MRLVGRDAHQYAYPSVVVAPTFSLATHHNALSGLMKLLAITPIEIPFLSQSKCFPQS
jgi:hypothetical protein